MKRKTKPLSTKYPLLVYSESTDTIRIVHLNGAYEVMQPDGDFSWGAYFEGDSLTGTLYRLLELERDGALYAGEIK